MSCVYVTRAVMSRWGNIAKQFLRVGWISIMVVQIFFDDSWTWTFGAVNSPVVVFLFVFLSFVGAGAYFLVEVYLARLAHCSWQLWHALLGKHQKSRENIEELSLYQIVFACIYCVRTLVCT